VSKRSERRRGARTAGEQSAAGAERAAQARETGAGGSRDRRAAVGSPSWGLGVQLVFLAAVFGVAVLVAELAGAANLGVALGVGQIAFTIAVVYLLLRH
jgi:hypothetical protein